MPQVGDRFYFITDNRNGGERFGRRGEQGIITAFNIRGYGRFRFVDQNRARELEFEPHFELEDVHLINAEEPEPDVDVQEVVTYLIIARRDFNGEILRYTRREATDAEELVRILATMEVTVLKKLKIKTRIPVHA